MYATSKVFAELFVFSPASQRPAEWHISKSRQRKGVLSSEPPFLAYSWQKALFDAGIPLTSFGVDHIEKEHARLEKLGARFKTKPTKMGPVTVAVLDDTCGNLIQIVQG
jgi:hypothetical protein